MSIPFRYISSPQIERKRSEEYLDNNTVECVTTYKLLGIIISTDLKWNEHIDYISKKASKRLYSLRILKKVDVGREGILKVYVTTIIPIYLEYGVQVWKDIPEFLSNKLESIQKRALYIIYPCHSYLDALKGAMSAGEHAL